MPHLGNWVGAIRPTVTLSQDPNYQGYLFLADYHALTGLKDGPRLRQYSYGLAAAWIALGIDPEKTVFYRQSDVPEVFELAWILACFSPKGLMNRAHAYKAIVQRNQESGEEDWDIGVNMGLYTYPILMAADILLMSTNLVPVGSDQQQHVEIARDLAQYFNRNYQREIFTLPDALIDANTAVLPGIDGRKMSKSYENHIPIFETPEHIKKLIMRIQTDSSRPGEPKDPARSTIFQLYQVMAEPDEIQALARAYAQGIAWKDAKDALYARFEDTFRGPNERYQALISDTDALDRVFAKGAERARERAARLMGKIRRAVGVSRTNRA